ncbi:MAG: hypothetical protein GWO41_16840 [candidate division Zixibacteria bacterium]|nr:hypothetical protein [candidate division Zixibacteria bacterium]NIR66435.1 hypothetical protein [candidate division Zixibacteria bacterium]NIS18079.1 hypothetical protein [candidate division Zixibacteria bacterium]NIS48025.1 hypothetical protein [candidate division Zixibacteria bacterium]NIT54359.1 hypothetical protein [candidate division Zixibacteria bacterium]
MDDFNAPAHHVGESKEKEKEKTEFTLRKEIGKVLGGTLEGAFELKGGMGLLITIKKDDKPFALVVQRPSNGVDPAKDTDVYISEGIG